MVTLNISRSTLVEHGACPEGLAFFDTRYPGGETGPIEWTSEVLAQQLRDPEAYTWVRWAIVMDLLPRLSMRGADLRGAHLSVADLSGAYLTWAHLRGADLRGADLSRAHLHGAHLHGAYLREADLRGADLREADLRGAYLSGALRRATDPPINGWSVTEGRLVRAAVRT